jgi:hypothetical protein
MRSLTLRDEQMFENKIQRKIFGLTRDEGSGEYSISKNEELHYLLKIHDFYTFLAFTINYLH